MLLKCLDLAMIKSLHAVRVKEANIVNAILSGSDCVMLSGETAAGVWTLTRPTRPARLAFKRKERMKKLSFPVLKNPPPVRNGVVWSLHLLFIFIFKMRKIK